jgi:hypothetical protein
MFGGCEIRCGEEGVSVLTTGDAKADQYMMRRLGFQSSDGLDVRLHLSVATPHISPLQAKAVSDPSDPMTTKAKPPPHHLQQAQSTASDTSAVNVQVVRKKAKNQEKRQARKERRKEDFPDKVMRRMCDTLEKREASWRQTRVLHTIRESLVRQQEYKRRLDILYDENVTFHEIQPEGREPAIQSRCEFLHMLAACNSNIGWEILINEDWPDEVKEAYTYTSHIERLTPAIADLEAEEEEIDLLHNWRKDLFPQRDEDVESAFLTVEEDEIDYTSFHY